MVMDNVKPEARREHIFEVTDCNSMIILAAAARAREIRTTVPSRSPSKVAIACTDNEAGEIADIAASVLRAYDEQRHGLLLEILVASDLPVPRYVVRILENLGLQRFTDQLLSSARPVIGKGQRGSG